MNNIVGIDTTSSKSPVTKFLSDLEDFIDEEVVIGEDGTQGEEDEGEQEELVATEIETQNVEVQKKIEEVKEQEKEVQKVIDEKNKTHKISAALYPRPM